MSRRRLYYLLEVGQFVRNWEISKTDAEKIGWTKMQLIAEYIQRRGLLTNDVVRECLSIAQVSTVRSLRQNLEGRIGGQQSKETKAVVFEFSVGARAELNEALIAFGAKLTHRGLVGKNKALTRIVRIAMELGKKLD